MTPEDTLERLLALLAERGIREEKSADARAAWKVFCEAALEPVDAVFEGFDGEQICLGEGPEGDLLEHNSTVRDGHPDAGTYEPTEIRLPIFCLDLRRQFWMYSVEGDETFFAGKGILTLTIEFEGDPGRMGVRALCWGYAGPRRDDVDDEQRSGFDNWAGHVTNWAAKVEASDSFEAFEQLAVRGFRIDYTEG